MCWKPIRKVPKYPSKGLHFISVLVIPCISLRYMNGESVFSQRAWGLFGNPFSACVFSSYVSSMFSQTQTRNNSAFMLVTGKWDAVQNWKETLKAEIRPAALITNSHVHLDTFFSHAKKISPPKKVAREKVRRQKSETGKGSRSKIRRARKEMNKKIYSLDPSLGGLDGEEGDHGRGAVIVVECFEQPLALGDLWQLLAELTKFKVFAPGREWDKIKNVLQLVNIQTARPDAFSISE